MEIINNTDDRIIKRDIEQEMKQSYLDYSMSVIVGRALPDVRDGLKPVHRRVLYTMWELGLLHNKPFKKSANVVGNCMARFHPHGDMSIYDTLVRLAQNFSMRYTLVDGQGNFGSIDGDSPAAMRYTEVRLKKLSEEMLEDIDKETVKFIPNFDNSLQEPTVLPSRIPNLLINGSSGIAVGMATNMPPHNISEVIDGLIMLIDAPEADVKEIMNLISGPDFPTGGTICGRGGIYEAYKTGKGKIIIRANHIMEKGNIIITEIPYMVNKSELISHIAELAKDKKIEGIFDIRDESDKDGIRIVIELKNAEPEIVLNQIYKHSKLQISYGIIMLALVNNVPKILALKDILHYFIEHRVEIVRRRTEFELKNAREKTHILEGILIALDDIDGIIALIRGSKDVGDARKQLIGEYSLSEKQAVAILDMRLQRLTSLEQENVRKEHSSLLSLIEELVSILGSDKKILDIIKQELLSLKKEYRDERRTKIIEEELGSIEIEDLIEKENSIITITRQGYIKRIPVDTYIQQRRGGKGIIAAPSKEEDFVSDFFVANTHDYLLFFTDKGMVHWMKVYKIPVASRQALGKPVVNLLELGDNGKITAFVPVRGFLDSEYLLMATKKGIVKKTRLSAYSNPRRKGIISITLEPDDELISSMISHSNQEIVLATRNGMAVRFSEEDVRETGRSSRGVRGITLNEGDTVISMNLVEPTDTLFTITENGYGKRTKIDDYRLIGRRGKGVINIDCSERNGKVSSVIDVKENDEIMVITRNGVLIRMQVSQISVIGRNTQGMRIIRLDSDDKVVSAVKIVEEMQSLTKN